MQKTHKTNIPQFLLLGALSPHLTQKPSSSPLPTANSNSCSDQISTDYYGLDDIQLWMLLVNLTCWPFPFCHCFFLPHTMLPTSHHNPHLPAVSQGAWIPNPRDLASQSLLPLPIPTNTSQLFGQPFSCRSLQVPNWFWLVDLAPSSWWTTEMLGAGTVCLSFPPTRQHSHALEGLWHLWVQHSLRPRVEQIKREVPFLRQGQGTPPRLNSVENS